MSSGIPEYYRSSTTNRTLAQLDIWSSTCLWCNQWSWFLIVVIYVQFRMPDPIILLRDLCHACDLQAVFKTYWVDDHSSARAKSSMFQQNSALTKGKSYILRDHAISMTSGLWKSAQQKTFIWNRINHFSWLEHVAFQGQALCLLWGVITSCVKRFVTYYTSTSLDSGYLYHCHTMTLYPSEFSWSLA